MITDLHAHFVPDELAACLRARRDAPRIGSRADTPEVFHLPIGSLAFSSAFTDIDQRIAMMDDWGVDLQLLSLPGLFGIDSLPLEQARPLVRIFNDEVGEVARRRPDRFAALAALPLADMDAARDELERCVRRLGHRGVILPINGFVTLTQARRLAPIFELAHAARLHVFIHPGRRADEVRPVDANKIKPVFEDNFLPRQALAVQSQVASAMITLLFSDFLEPYPGVSVHVANLGGTLPMVVERMDHMVTLRTPEATLPSRHIHETSLHVDCSSLGSRAIELAVAVFGAERIVLGTDCPIFSTEWSLWAVRSARISDDDKRAILGVNAERLLGHGERA